MSSFSNFIGFAQQISVLCKFTFARSEKVNNVGGGKLDLYGISFESSAQDAF